MNTELEVVTAVRPLAVELCLSAMDFYTQYAVPGIPVLLKGIITDSPLMQSASFEALTTTFGNVHITARRSGQTEERQFSLEEYLSYAQETRESAPYYLTNWAHSAENAKLFASYDLIPYFPNWFDLFDDPKVPKLKWFIIGPAGSFSPMHLDVMNTSAWNGLISGRKRWTFRKADGTEFVCEQEPGDVVFTPSGWWHGVHNITPTVCVTENFVNDTNVEQVEDFLEKSSLKYLALALQRLRERHS